MTTHTATPRMKVAPRWLSTLIITISLGCGGILLTGGTTALAEALVQAGR